MTVDFGAHAMKLALKRNMLQPLLVQHSLLAVGPILEPTLTHVYHPNGIEEWANLKWKNCMEEDEREKRRYE